MSDALFFLIFIIVVFGILIVGMHFFKKDALFTIAIGSIIGATIYNSTAYPIEINGIIFGLDSIIYTIFCFCLLLMYVDYGKKDMKVVLYTSLFSIFFSSFLMFMAGYSQGGYSTTILNSALISISSIIATYVAMWGMVWFYSQLTKHGTNKYIATLLSLLFCAVINSFLYFALFYLYMGDFGDTFLYSLAGSYVGKIVASALCLVVLAFHKSPQPVEQTTTKTPSKSTKPKTNVTKKKTTKSTVKKKTTSKVESKKTTKKKPVKISNIK